MKKFLLFFALIAVYALSVLVRLPMLEERVHIWQTGNIFMLTTLEIWHEKGVSKSYFSPINTWPNAGDKHMHLYKRLEDSEGNNYYTSHPPFSFQLAHAILWITGSKPSHRILKGLGLLFHLITATSIFWLVFLLSKNVWSSFIAFAVCTFFPILMYGFTFHYFSETVGLGFWAICVASLYWSTKQKSLALWQWILLGLTSFLFVYSDWMGVFFIISALAYLIVSKPELYKKLSTVLTGFAALALLLIFIQYNSIAGVQAFLHSISIRFLERSGFFGKAYSDQQMSMLNPASYQMLVEQFHHLLKWVGYFFVLLSVAFGLMARKKEKTPNPAFQPLLFLVLIPALLHFAVFFNANVTHYLYHAKWGIVIATLTGLIIGAMPNAWTKWIATGALAISIYASVVFLRNDIPEDPWENYIINMSTPISGSTKPDEAIFIQGAKPEHLHYFIYCAKRNMLPAENYEEALQLSQKLGKEKGYLYKLDGIFVEKRMPIPLH